MSARRYVKFANENIENVRHDLYVLMNNSAPSLTRIHLSIRSLVVCILEAIAPVLNPGGGPPVSDGVSSAVNKGVFVGTQSLGIHTLMRQALWPQMSGNSQSGRDGKVQRCALPQMRPSLTFRLLWALTTLFAGTKEEEMHSGFVIRNIRHFHPSLVAIG